MRSVKVKGIKRFLVAVFAVFLFSIPNANSSIAIDVDNWTDFESNITSGNDVTITGPITQTGSPPIPSVNVTGNVKINGGTNTITGATGASQAPSMLNVSGGGTLTIEGGKYTGTNGDKGGVVSIKQGGTLNIGQNSSTEKVEFTGNTANLGGAIYNEGNAQISNAVFENNEATNTNISTDGRGGAIFNSIDAEMTISDSTFTNNTADNWGGAIYNEGSLTNVVNSTFTGNQAQHNGGAISNFVGESTAAAASATAIIKDSQFISNIAGNGGAIYNSVNGENTNAILSIENSIFKENTASNTAGGGGAIYNNGEATVINSTFESNRADNGNGGAIFNMGRTDTNYAENKLIISGANTEFRNNYAQAGGAIANQETLDVQAGTFSNNGYYNGNTTARGGAIFNSPSSYNDSVATIASGAKFENNVATNGGAIYNASANNHTAKLNISGATFNNNGILKSDDGSVLSSTSKGGAIYNEGSTAQDSILTVGNQATFTGNYAQEGGAIYNTGTATITDSTFTGNGSYTDNTGAVQTSTHGGAIYIGKSSQNANTTTIERNVFDGNSAGKGGAIYNNGGSDSNFVAINSNTFRNNTADYGGAIYNNASLTDPSTVLTISGNRFENNYAKREGGAIYNNGTMSVKDSAFVNNGISGDTATEKGGAVYNTGVINITDTSFVGNKADKGGALYGNSGSISNIFAENNNVYIGSDNPALDTIYLESGIKDSATVAATMNLNAMTDKNIYLNSAVSGEEIGANGLLANVNINPDEKYTGNVVVNANIDNTNLTLNRGMLQFIKDEYLTQSNTLNLNGGILNMLNGNVRNIGAANINVLNDTKLLLDVDLKNKTMDSILSSNSKVNYTGGHLDIIGLNAITDSTEKNVDILFTDVDAIAGNGVVRSEKNMEVKGPLYDYIVNQEFKTVNGIEGEYFAFNSTGFNPSTNIPGVAAQLGGYLMMDNIYRQAFANMDMVMSMTRAERQALKMRNKYAAADKRAVWAPAVIPEERDGIWLRPFSNFENVSLKNGPKVSNIFYGSLIGADSDIVYLGKGWDGTFSVYGAYTGSHQAFQGNDIWQNGGILGASGILYKGNFFTGLTYNAGGSAVEATSMFGRENFGMFMTGLAWKSGYNFGFADDKFIIQPSYMMSYTFVNSSDYTNGAGLRITSDPLHAIEIIPGIKFIANLQNGWQPYFGVNMVWNIIDDTHFFAQDVALPQLSVKPYIEYGPGIQKRYGDRFTGFGQAMIRNGGRNGVAFTLGARWAIGD